MVVHPYNTNIEERLKQEGGGLGFQDQTKKNLVFNFKKKGGIWHATV